MEETFAMEETVDSNSFYLSRRGEKDDENPLAVRRAEQPPLDYAFIYRYVNEVSEMLGTGKVRCTEVMAMHRMVVQLDSLSVEALGESAHIIKHLIVFADVVEVQKSSFDLPGSSSITIVCRLLHLLTNQQQLEINLPYWTVHQNATPLPHIAYEHRFSIHTHHIVSSAATLPMLPVPLTHQYYDTVPELQYVTSSRFSIYSRATSTWAPRDDYPTPKLSWSWSLATGLSRDILNDPNIIMGIQSTLLIAEMIMCYRTDLPDAVYAAKEHTQWVNDILLEVVSWPDSGEALELKALLARAEMLMKLPTDGSHSLIVPRLNYNGYNDLIDAMVNVADRYLADYRHLISIITPIQILGEDILNQTKLMAQKERDVEALELTIEGRKRQELERAMRTMSTLEAQLDHQTTEMEKAQREMEEGVMQYKNRQVAEAFIGLLGAIVGIGVSIATGGVTAKSAAVSAVRAVRNLSSLADMVKMVVTIVEKLTEAMEVLSAVKNLVDAIKDLNEMVEAPEMPDMPSIAEWDIFENEVELVASDMMDIDEAAAPARVWRAKCKNVAALCREVSRTGVYIGELQFDLFVHEQQRRVARRHAERLEAVEARDLNNYLELATELDMRTGRLLMSMLKVMATQHAALRYHYLLPRQPLIGWPSMQSVSHLMIQKKNDAVNGLESLGPSNDYVVNFTVEDIPVDLLASGEDWNFSIDPFSNSPFLFSWSQVRVRYVEIKFATAHPQPHTDSGLVYLLLQASRTFYDRRERQVFEYEAASPVIYQYAYNLETGSTTTSNMPSPHDDRNALFFRSTPFTNWRLRLPTSAHENQNLSFSPTSDTTTKIDITFHLLAIRAIDPFSADDADIDGPETGFVFEGPFTADHDIDEPES